MFFLDDDLCRRPVSRIRVISAGRSELRSGSQRWVHDVEMDDGTKLVILDVTAQQISRLPAHVLPAQPGTMAWTPDPDEEADFVNPIIGWAVTMDGNTLPLIPGASIDDWVEGTAIIAPDGRVWQNGFVQAAELQSFRQLNSNS